LSKLDFSEADLTDISPEAHQFALNRLRTLKYGDMYLPPTTQGTLVMPGLHGGANWSGACADPETGILYVNTSNWPMILKMPDAAPDDHNGYNTDIYLNLYFVDHEGLPAIKPPWGLLTAVNLA